MDMSVRKERWAWIGVLIGAAVVAILSAEPFAGSWNDGGRLATVESLVDRGTLAIDDSIFVNVPPGSSPYAVDNPFLRDGTRDKLFIDGHYYSHHSPVPAFFMAGAYRIWRWAGGPSAVERFDRYCWFINLISSGLAFVIAVGCLFAIGGRIGLPLGQRLLFTVFFGLGTVALPYAQHVNNHVLFLAAAAWLFLLLLKANRDGWTTRQMLGIGTAVGIAYTIDLGAGPMLVVVVAGLFIVERLSPRQIACAGLAAFPWFLFYHAVNWSIGGTFGPASRVPEYLCWPGSPFNAYSMTGSWQQPTLYNAMLYALDMLFLKKGFLGHNLLIFLPLFALPWLVRSRYPERRIVVAGLVWSVSVWLLYSATSTNQSGACCSVRWFVPLLVPAFVALAVVLRERPELRTDACILGAGGVLVGLCMARVGTWQMRAVPGYWTLYPSTIFVWGSYRYWRWKRPPVANAPVITIEHKVAA
jgi:hypothetical protein